MRPSEWSKNFDWRPQRTGRIYHAGEFSVTPDCVSGRPADNRTYDRMAIAKNLDVILPKRARIRWAHAPPPNLVHASLGQRRIHPIRHLGRFSYFFKADVTDEQIRPHQCSSIRIIRILLF